MSNESSEIIRMLNTEFNEFIQDEEKRKLDLYPEHLRADIDAVNAWIYPYVYEVTSCKNQIDSTAPLVSIGHQIFDLSAPHVIGIKVVFLRHSLCNCKPISFCRQKSHCEALHGGSLAPHSLQNFALFSLLPNLSLSPLPKLISHAP